MMTNKKKTLSAQLTEKLTGKSEFKAPGAESVLIKELRERQKLLRPEVFSDRKVEVK